LFVLALPVDAAALVVLGILDAVSFTPGDSSVSQCLVFQVVHAVLAAFEPAGFLSGQLARFDSSFYALVLLFLPVIDARRGLRERESGKRDGCCCDCCNERFVHDELLMAIEFSFLILDYPA
jgi:hypothetical protein